MTPTRKAAAAAAAVVVAAGGAAAQQTFLSGPNGLTIISLPPGTYVEVFASAGRSQCPCNLDGSVWADGGALSPVDVAAFVAEWFSEINATGPTTLAADWNNDGRLTPEDIAAFVVQWYTGCPGTDLWMEGQTSAPGSPQPISLTTGTYLLQPEWRCAVQLPTSGTGRFAYLPQWSQAIIIPANGMVTFNFSIPVDVRYVTTGDPSCNPVPPPYLPGWVQPTCLSNGRLLLRRPSDVGKPTPSWLQNALYHWPRVMWSRNP